MNITSPRLRVGQAGFASPGSPTLSLTHSPTHALSHSPTLPSFSNQRIMSNFNIGA